MSGIYNTATLASAYPSASKMLFLISTPGQIDVLVNINTFWLKHSVSTFERTGNYLGL